MVISARASRMALGLVGAGLLTASCKGDRTFSEPQTLGGEEVSTETLNLGLKAYTRYCVGCHGRRGAGGGTAAWSMKPRPRDFTRGSFKFHSVPAGKLPTDEDLMRTIRSGSKGTHMPAWTDLPKAEVQAVARYIKTFSPRWRSEKPGAPVKLARDPWIKKRGAAVLTGEALYHGVAQCWACHPAYAGRAKVAVWRKQVDPTAAAEGVKTRSWKQALLRASKVKSAAYGALTPPDFISDSVRLAHTPEALARTVAVGIGGTPMTGWLGKLDNKQIWAVAHYVQNLIDKKGTPAADALRSALANAGAPTMIKTTIKTEMDSGTTQTGR
jgi:mono/diheme cytochrome c family protein